MISSFEYITVLISIILGLGITQILTGIADLIHQSKRVKMYWPHALWVWVVLILHVQDWWATYDLRSFGAWSLPLFLFIMIYPVMLFVMARLLFPFGLQEGIIDLKEFYVENYRKIFAFGSVLPLLSILDAVLVRGIEIETQVAKLVLPIILLIVASRKKPFAEWVHQLISVAMFAILTVTIIVEWKEWILSS